MSLRKTRGLSPCISQGAPLFLSPVLKEILLMSRLKSSRTAQIWAERFV